MLRKSSDRPASGARPNLFINFDPRIPAFMVGGDRYDILEDVTLVGAQYEYRAKINDAWSGLEAEDYYALAEDAARNIEAAVTMRFTDGQVARLNFNLATRLGAAIMAGLAAADATQPVTLRCGAMAKGTAFAGDDGKHVVLQADIQWANVSQGGAKIRVSPPDIRKVPVRNRDDFAVVAAVALAKKLGTDIRDPLDEFQ